MHNPMRITSALLIIILAALSSGTSACRGKKNVVTADTTATQPVSGCKIDYKLPKVLAAEMGSHEMKFEWLSAKLDCEAKTDSSRVAFDVNVRMRRDSVIWLNITDPTLGIRVARVLITTDSVKFVNFLNNSCFRGDFAYLSQLLQTEVDFDMMQSLLVGNSVAFYNDDEKLKAQADKQNCHYILSTVRKRRLRKVEEGRAMPEEPLQTLTLDPQTFKILNVFFIDAQLRTFKADYSEFSDEGGILFPHKATFFAKGVQKSAELNASYRKITLNEPQQFPFNLPDDCTPIQVTPTGKQ
jgi:hypothetical protein